MALLEKNIKVNAVQSDIWTYNLLLIVDYVSLWRTSTKAFSFCRTIRIVGTSAYLLQLELRYQDLLVATIFFVIQLVSQCTQQITVHVSSHHFFVYVSEGRKGASDVFPFA